MTHEETAFLIALTELSRKHGIVVTGCGCCGSPSLRKLEPSQMVPDAGYGANDGSDVQWLAPGDYEWKLGNRPAKEDQ